MNRSLANHPEITLTKVVIYELPIIYSIGRSNRSYITHETITIITCAVQSVHSVHSPSSATDYTYNLLTTKYQNQISLKSEFGHQVKFPARFVIFHSARGGEAPSPTERLSRFSLSKKSLRFCARPFSSDFQRSGALRPLALEASSKVFNSSTTSGCSK